MKESRNCYRLPTLRRIVYPISHGPSSSLELLFLSVFFAVVVPLPVCYAAVSAPSVALHTSSRLPICYTLINIWIMQASGQTIEKPPFPFLPSASPRICFASLCDEPHSHHHEAACDERFGRLGCEKIMANTIRALQQTPLINCDCLPSPFLPASQQVSHIACSCCLS